MAKNQGFLAIQAFQMPVIAYDKFVTSERFRELGVEGVDALDEFYARADFITLHLPKTFETVDFIDNYDGKYREPLVLPCKFPNLMVNGSDGIAVGMATEIPPHNLGEVCDAVIRLIDDPDVTVDQLIDLVPGPDFPTGGVICGKQGILDGYRTGRALVFTDLCVFRLDTGTRELVVVEIMPGVTKDRIREATGFAERLFGGEHQLCPGLIPLLAVAIGLVSVSP